MIELHGPHFPLRTDLLSGWVTISRRPPVMSYSGLALLQLLEAIFSPVQQHVVPELRKDKA
jgi:hypothetical protein